MQPQIQSADPSGNITVTTIVPISDLEAAVTTAQATVDNDTNAVAQAQAQLAADQAILETAQANLSAAQGLQATAVQTGEVALASPEISSPTISTVSHAQV